MEGKGGIRGFKHRMLLVCHHTHIHIGLKYRLQKVIKRSDSYVEFQRML